MDDWFHCNSCFLQPDENNQNRQQFYLTSCGHIFCEHCGCFTESTSDRCKLCKTKCLSTKIGDEEFKKNKDIQEYFQKPIETGERLLNVLKFQKSHTSKLIKHHQLIITKYNRAKLYIKKLESELKNAKRALKNTPQNHNFTESCSSSVLEFDATPFKMIHAGVEEQNILRTKPNIPDSVKYRNLSIQHDISTASSGVTTLSTESSKYNSHDNLDEQFMQTMDVMHLKSTGKRNCGRK